MLPQHTEKAVFFVVRFAHVYQFANANSKYVEFDKETFCHRHNILRHAEQKASARKKSIQSRMKPYYHIDIILWSLLFQCKDGVQELSAQS